MVDKSFIGCHLSVKFANTIRSVRRCQRGIWKVLAFSLIIPVCYILFQHCIN